MVVLSGAIFQPCNYLYKDSGVLVKYSPVLLSGNMFYRSSYTEPFLIIIVINVVLLCAMLKPAVSNGICGGQKTTEQY